MTKFRSGFEQKLAALAAFKDAKYEKTRLEYLLPISTYIVDFEWKNGLIIEAKGFFRASDRTKMRLIKAFHPTRDIRMVLQTPYKTLSKDSMTTYAAWCEKHGFPWCAGNDLETLNAWAAEKKPNG